MSSNQAGPQGQGGFNLSAWSIAQKPLIFFLKPFTLLGGAMNRSKPSRKSGHPHR